MDASVASVDCTSRPSSLQRSDDRNVAPPFSVASGGRVFVRTSARASAYPEDEIERRLSDKAFNACRNAIWTDTLSLDDIKRGKRASSNSLMSSAGRRVVA